MLKQGSTIPIGFRIACVGKLRSAALAAWFAAALVCLNQVQTAYSAGIVSDCTEESFLAALAGGGDVVFTDDCDITLTAPIVIYDDTTIDADGYSVRLSGGGSVRLFSVAQGANLTLNGLTLRLGSSTNGGAMYIDWLAKVSISDCTFVSNSAAGATGATGTTGKSSADANGSDGGPGDAGAPARGGAIYNLGDLTIESSTFQTNYVKGGNGGAGGTGGDGQWNAGDGGPGGNGGEVEGGAIYSTAPLTLSKCTFANNAAIAGNGGNPGAGGSGPFRGFEGLPGKGAYAAGGGVYSKDYLSVDSCTFSGNIATGGNSASGGAYDTGNGADGLRGGHAYGGAAYNIGDGSFLNCTVSGNTVKGGAGGDGGQSSFLSGNGGDGGNAFGGGLYNSNALSLVYCTIAGCSAIGGTNGGSPGRLLGGRDGSPGLARGGGVCNGGGTFSLENTILGASLQGKVGYGTFEDLKVNISADNSVSLSAPSMMNTDPKLGTLADNGGPTQTIMLLSGSPAANAGHEVPGVEEDQRGYARPESIDGLSDIGALEGGLPTITVQPQTQTGHLDGAATFKVTATGDSTLSYQWYFNGTNQIANATNSVYRVVPIATNDVGSYQVVVTNEFGAVTSAPAFLVVSYAPKITTQPASQTVLQGNTVQFFVVAVGSEPLAYQWKFGTNALPGQISTVLSLTNVQPENAGSYSVTVTNSVGSVTSTNAVLTVTPLITAGISSNGFTFTFVTQPSRTYVTSYKDLLSDSEWIPLSTNAGTGNPITISQPATNQPSRFFRTTVQ